MIVVDREFEHRISIRRQFEFLSVVDIKSEDEPTKQYKCIED